MIGDMRTQTANQTPKIPILVIFNEYLLDFEAVNLVIYFLKITASGREALSYL